MNSLQKYLKIKKISAAQIAEGTGLGYHSVQKTILGVKKGRVVRNAIADYLKLSYIQIWGTAAPRNLKRLIKQAIDQSLEQQRRSLTCRYLQNSLPNHKAVGNG